MKYIDIVELLCQTEPIESILCELFCIPSLYWTAKVRIQYRVEDMTSECQNVLIWARAEDMLYVNTTNYKLNAPFQQRWI